MIIKMPTGSERDKMMTKSSDASRARATGTLRDTTLTGEGAAAAGYPAAEQARADAGAGADTRAYACACEGMTWREAYECVFGKAPHGFAEMDVRFYAERGIAEALVVVAIRIASEVEKPSWRYVVAVLAGFLKEGVRTVEDVNARHAAHVATLAKGGGRPQQEKQVLAQQYTQREYTREELESLIEPIL